MGDMKLETFTAAWNVLRENSILIGLYQDGVGSFRFRFPGTGCLAFRFVGAYGSVRFAKMIGSFRFVSHFYLTYFPFRFVSFPFHRRFVTSVSSLEENNAIFWRACGSGGLEFRSL